MNSISVNKKRFLAMDMVERIIRVEQTVSSHFGEKLDVKDTNYFKSLTPQVKKTFLEYCKSKKRKNKLFFIISLLIPIFILSVLNLTITGNVVKTEIEKASYFSLNKIFFIFFISCFAILIFLKIKSKLKDIKFNNNARIIYDLYKKRRMLTIDKSDKKVY